MRYVLPMHGVLIVFAGVAVDYLFQLISTRQKSV
jgi:hypothetical protein